MSYFFNKIEKMESFKEKIENIINWNVIISNWDFNPHLENSMLSEEFAETIIAIKNRDKREVVDWILDILWVWIWTLYKLWLTSDEIYRAFEEIENSNFSKLIKEDWEWIALRDTTGKVIKPAHYKKPDLSFIEN